MKFISSYLIPTIAVLAVAISVFYSGLQKYSDAKNVDTRYFYLAAKCWASGRSPYEPATYEAMSRSEFGEPPAALFVAYLPTLMPVVLPMAPFGWSTAAKLFSIMNFCAAMILFWACYRLVREYVGEALRPVHWFWISLAASIGAISGTITTGQTSVFIAAAAALALLGCRLQKTWLTVVGLVIASAKPHLSGPLLLFIVVFEPRQRKAVYIAAGIAALIVGYAAAVDTNLISSYLGSVAAYGRLAVNDSARLIGLLPLLEGLGVSGLGAKLFAVCCLLAVMGLAVWLLRRRSASAFTDRELAVMLVVFSIGLVRPIQGYDLCAYAVGIALLAATGPYFQAASLLPALLIWRPDIVEKLHLPILKNFAASVAWMGLLIACIVLAVRASDNVPHAMRQAGASRS